MVMSGEKNDKNQQQMHRIQREKNDSTSFFSPKNKTDNGKMHKWLKRKERRPWRSFVVVVAAATAVYHHYYADCDWEDEDDDKKANTGPNAPTMWNAQNTFMK